MEVATATTTTADEVVHPNAAKIGAKSEPREIAIGALFAGTGVSVVLLMGVLGLLMRLNQAHAIHISAGFFYRIMTMHGAGMIVATLLAMMGGIWFAAHQSIPLSVGRALWSYAMIVGGAVLVIVAVMIGGFATGWTFLFPLPFHAAGEWSLWAVIVFIIGVTLVALGFFLFCTDMVLKSVDRYGSMTRALGIDFIRDLDDDPPPPSALAAISVGIQGMIAMSMGVVVLIALLARAVDGKVVMDALWAKDLTYQFGHSIANLVIYLAAGMLYVLIPRYTGRKWKTTKPLAVGWLATAVIVLTAFSHHLYMDFVQPEWAQLTSQVISSLAAVPVAVVTIYTAMVLVWGSRYRWTLASTLLYLGFAGWAIGGVGAVMDSLIPLNFRFHNTLWVPAHFHTYMMLGVVIWMLAFVAHLIERAAGQAASRFATVAAPVCLMAGGYGLVGVWFASGALGIPRRYADQFGHVTGWSVAAAIAALTFALGFLIVLTELSRLALVAKANGGFKRAFEPDPIDIGGGAEASAEPAPAADASARTGPPVVAGWRALVAVIAAAGVAIVSFLPQIDKFAEEHAQWHHLQHAGQFLFGMLLAVAVACTPTIAAKVRWRSQNLALAAVIVAPIVMLLAMTPTIYTSLENDSFVHGLYHLGIVALGFITGFALTAFNRSTAWLVFLLMASMGVVYAAGIGL